MLKIKANKELPFSFYKIKRIFLDWVWFWSFFFWFCYYYRGALKFIYYCTFVKHYFIKFRERRWSLPLGEEYVKRTIVVDDESADRLFDRIELNFFYTWTEVQCDLTLIGLKYIVTLKMFFDFFNSLKRIKENVKKAKHQHGRMWAFIMFFFATIKEVLSPLHYIRIKIIFYYVIILILYFMEVIWKFIISKILDSILMFFLEISVKLSTKFSVNIFIFSFLRYFKSFFFFDKFKIKISFFIRLKTLFVKIFFLNIKNGYFWRLRVLVYFRRFWKKTLESIVFVSNKGFEFSMWFGRYLFKFYLLFFYFMYGFFVILVICFLPIYFIFIFFFYAAYYIFCRIKDKWYLR
jgi:hypothetical protein